MHLFLIGLLYIKDRERERVKLRRYVHRTKKKNIPIEYSSVAMLKSQVTRVSGPSTSSRRRSPSDSPDYDNSPKRNRRSRTPTSPSGSESDNDDGDEKEDEPRPKPTTDAAPAKAAASTAPVRTGGLYMPPAKLRLLQVRILSIIKKSHFLHFSLISGIFN